MITVEIIDSAGATLTASYDHDGQAGRDILTGLSGWSGGVGVRGEEVERLSHGSFPAPSFRTGRTLTVDMMFERDTRAELWALERGASGLFANGGYGSITVSEDDEVASAEVRLDGDVKPTVHVDSGFITVQIPLHAPMPYIYSPSRESIIRPAEAGVGFEFPPLARDLGRGPVVTFGTAVDTDDLVWNDGNADSWARFTVTGNFPGGVALSVDGHRVTYPWPTFPDIPVTVDMAGAVTVGGVDQSHLLGERDWAPVPARSISKVALQPLQGGTGWATVQHRDTYM